MKKYILASLLTFVMIGCGGSSSSKKSESTTKLAGVAVDDLIINGIVKAYPANNPNNVLATGNTDSKGSYTLDVAYDGVVIVEVECKIDTSWMYNPVTPDKQIACVDGLKLNSAASVSPSHGAVEVNVSPLTELVVRQMKEKSTVTEQDLTAARNNIQQMFLVDPLEADPTEGNYAKIIGAIHKIDEQDDSKNILEVIDAIAEDYKDGEAGDDNQEMSEKLATAMEDAGVVNPLTYKKGKFEPVETDPNEDGIEVSKAFFSELRTQAMSIVNYQESGTPGFLDTEAQSLGTAIEGVSLNIGTASESAVNHVVKVLDLIDQNQTSRTYPNSERDKTLSYSKKSALVWNYEINVSGETTASGTITLPSENPDNISLKSYTGTLTAKFDGIVPLEFENFVATGHQTFKADISLTKQNNYGSDIAINNASLTSDTASVAMQDLKLKAHYSFDGDEIVMNHVLFDTVTLDANATPYNFSGTLSVPEYVQNNSIKDKGFMIKGSSSSGSVSTTDRPVSVSLDNRLQLREVNSDDEGFYNSGYLPKKIVFDGAITNSSNSGYIKGKITADWLNAKAMNLNGNSDAKAIVDVSIIGKIKAPERPEMMINLGFTNPSNHSDFRFVYAYDNTIINGTGAFDEEVENGTIILTTLNGLKTTIKVVNGDVVYGSQSNVTKDGTKIGELKDRQGIPIILYTDNSFESLP